MADYALVVGVSRYPDLSAGGGVADLEGPDHDALAVRDWLVDPQGGRLDPGNVRLVRSADADPPDPADPQPAAARIERELRWLEQQTGRTPGGRLYLYFSGHGFAPVLEEGALFTAEATQVFPSYVYAHAWLRWFRKAQLFAEFVLWMDCCMNFQQSIPVSEIQARVRSRTGVPGPAFVALAAQTGNALEFRMPDGQVHGVFTWTLLRGLRGGAADERGRVTGESLRTFLHNSMADFLPDEVKRAAAVDLQPFVRADTGMVFQRLPARPKHRVRLSVPPAAAGAELRIWTGRPHARVVSAALAGTAWTGDLVRGLYVAEVPAAGLRHGFQVGGTGDVDVAVSRPGPAVIPSDGSELFALNVTAANPAAAISVTDHRFERVFTETGALRERDMPGVYKVRVQIGRDIGTVTEEVILLDRDLGDHAATAPALPSPAPIPDSALTHEYHVAPFEAAADRREWFAAPAPGRAVVSILARYWTDPARRSAQPPHPHPMQGLELRDAAGGAVAHLAAGCVVDERSPIDPVAVWEAELSPGPYLLRLTLPGGRAFEGTVVASAGWVTQVALRRSSPAGDRRAAGLVPIEDVAVFLRGVGARPRPADQDAVIESARIALGQGRNLLGAGHGASLRELLLRTYEDPLAVMVGAHLLLRALDAAPGHDASGAEQFDAAVGRLLRWVGPEHPDAAALSLRCTDPRLRVAAPLAVPPMFVDSWRLLAEASYARPALLPARLWARMHASTRIGPFLVWAADEPSRAAHAAQLSQWIRSYAAAGDAREAARRLQVPAAAATVLWQDRSAG